MKLILIISQRNNKLSLNFFILFFYAVIILHKLQDVISIYDFKLYNFVFVCVYIYF